MTEEKENKAYILYIWKPELLLEILTHAEFSLHFQEKSDEL